MGCVLVTWGSKLAIEATAARLLDTPRGGSYLLAYTSSAVILCAVALLTLFAKMQVRGVARFTRFFAPLAFGVYLLHEEHLVHEHIIVGRFAPLTTLHPLLIPLAAVTCALAIWLSCSLVDHLRLRLFAALRVRERCEAFDAWVAPKARHLLRL